MQLAARIDANRDAEGPVRVRRGGGNAALAPPPSRVRHKAGREPPTRAPPGAAHLTRAPGRDRQVSHRPASRPTTAAATPPRPARAGHPRPSRCLADGGYARRQRPPGRPASSVGGALPAIGRSCWPPPRRTRTGPSPSRFVSTRAASCTACSSCTATQCRVSRPERSGSAASAELSRGLRLRGRVVDERVREPAGVSR